MFAQNTNNYNNYNNTGYVQQSQNVPEVKLDSLDSLMNGGGAKAFFNADSQPGATVTGEVVSTEVTQVTDFQSKQPAFWPSGQPKQQIHIVLQTSLPPEDEDDDGRRSLWIKGWGVQVKALRDACHKAGVKSPSKGDIMTAKFAGLGQRGNAPQAPKLYEYTIQPARQAEVDSMLSGQPKQPAQQAQNTPVQPVQQAQAAIVQSQPPVQAQASQQPAQQAPVQQSQPVQPNPWKQNLPVQQIQQLAQLGKTNEEIAGFLNISVQDVANVVGDWPANPTFD